MRRVRYDAKHNTLQCPRGKTLKAGRAVKHGRFFTSLAADCRHCNLARLCLSNGRVHKVVVLGDDYRPSCEFVAEENDGRTRTELCTSVTAGAQWDITAKRRFGTGYRERSGAAS